MAPDQHILHVKTLMMNIMIFVLLFSLSCSSSSHASATPFGETVGRLSLGDLHPSGHGARNFHNINNESDPFRRIRGPRNSPGISASLDEEDHRSKEEHESTKSEDDFGAEGPEEKSVSVAVFPLAKTGFFPCTQSGPYLRVRDPVSSTNEAPSDSDSFLDDRLVSGAYWYSAKLPLQHGERWVTCDTRRTLLKQFETSARSLKALEKNIDHILGGVLGIDHLDFMISSKTRPSTSTEHLHWADAENKSSAARRESEQAGQPRQSSSGWMSEMVEEMDTAEPIAEQEAARPAGVARIPATPETPGAGGEKDSAAARRRYYLRALAYFTEFLEGERDLSPEQVVRVKELFDRDEDPLVQDEPEVVLGGGDRIDASEFSPITSQINALHHSQVGFFAYLRSLVDKYTEDLEKIDEIHREVKKKKDQDRDTLVSLGSRGNRCGYEPEHQFMIHHFLL